jgi:hypothetical protein
MPSITLTSRKHRNDDYMDAAVRRPESKVMHGAMTENQNLRYVDLASWSLLLVQTQKLVTPQSHRKCIVRDTH